MDEIINRWSIVIPVYDQYELFRQCFESILHNMSVKEIIVVDDYSYPQGKLREYENYIEQKYDHVRIIACEEYRMCVHANDTDKRIDEQRNKERNMSMIVNRGHMLSLQTGIDAVNTDFVLALDADCVALEKTKQLLTTLTKLFDDNPNCMCIAQIAGFMSSEIKISDKTYPFTYAGKVNSEGGCPGSPAVACRMAGWKEHNIEKIAGSHTRAGWAYAYYAHDVYNKGFIMLNYPMLSEKNFFHVGGGIFCFARAGRRVDGRLGMCKDSFRYGGRTGVDVMCEWYQGRYVLDMKSAEYIQYLKNIYSVPFDTIQPPLDESLLYIVKNEVRE